MGKKGWNLNLLQKPNSIHLCITLRHTQEGVKKQFVKDLTNCSNDIINNSDKETNNIVAMYGMSAKIENKDIVNQVVYGYVDIIFKIYK